MYEWLIKTFYFPIKNYLIFVSNYIVKYSLAVSLIRNSSIMKKILKNIFTIIFKQPSKIICFTYET